MQRQHITTSHKQISVQPISKEGLPNQNLSLRLIVEHDVI